MGSAIARYRASLPASTPGRGLASYLTSRRNLTGSALALVGAGLALADPVGIQGLLLVAGLYLAGALAAGGKPRVSRLGFDHGRVQTLFAKKIGAAAGRVPPVIVFRMQLFELTSRTVIFPRLDWLPFGAPELYLIERSGSDYLPMAVEAYL